MSSSGLLRFEDHFAKQTNQQEIFCTQHNANNKRLFLFNKSQLFRKKSQNGLLNYALCVQTTCFNGRRISYITGYLKNYWTKHRLVCTHFDAFSMLIPNMVTIFNNSDICYFLLRENGKYSVTALHIPLERVNIAGTTFYILKEALIICSVSHGKTMYLLKIYQHRYSF